MFVQKKYPKVPYTMTVELTQENVEKIMHEAVGLDTAVRLANYYTETIAPTLCQLLAAIRQEARVPYGC